MKIILFFVLTSTVLFSCQQSNDTRCSLYDGECQKNLLQTIARDRAETGLPELGIPVIEPFALKNIDLSILGLLKLTLVEGEAEGISTCTATRFESNVEERFREAEMICSKITIRGSYKLTPSPVTGNICGWCNINGEGNGAIELEDWAFKFRYGFRFVRRQDSQIYLDPLFDNAAYEASVKKVTVTADCIRSGKRDITKDVVSFINNNWRAIMDSSIGKFINDESAIYYYDVYKLFYDKSPANTFLKDDLEVLLDTQK